MIDLYRGAAALREGPTSGKEAAARAPARCRWWLLTWPCEAEPATGSIDDAVRTSYARTAATELELLFPRLPNPDIYIYVPPHLATAERIPVPGYTTAVPLYERVEYALPGETSGPGARGGAETRAETEAPP